LKLLILTQYFPPEVGAPQNRLFELAVRLHKAGIDVTVLTAMPNYPRMEVYAGYRGKKYVYEEREGLKIHRTYIYVSKSKSILSRLFNYFSFVISSAVTGWRKLPDADFLMCESPPLFLGYSAIFLAGRKKARLIFNVSDLWPESAEKLGVISNKPLLKMAYNLEARLYRESVLVTGQTRGICKNISERFPKVSTYWLPNGVDLHYFDPAKTPALDWRIKYGFTPDDFIFLYAGIIGIAQGLQVILEAARNLMDRPSIKFVLMGSGPEKQKLVGLQSEWRLTNLFFLEPVPKLEMPVVLKNVNAAIVPLRKLDLFLGAIPSKIFENLAMQVPLVLGVDGEARELFIERANAGVYFEPENVTALIQAAVTLAADQPRTRQLGANGREFVNVHFNRENIAAAFLARLRSI
jgi:glycosyltransferase involved in cell wall biosynthesis